MGTREVYEEKLRRGNLEHDPTINPGLGNPRCPRCLSLLNPHSENEEWTITSVLHDATAVAGRGTGGMLSAIHGFNTGIPFVQKHVKGPKWLPFIIGVPPLLIFSAASAVFGGRNVLFNICFRDVFSDILLTSACHIMSGTSYALPKFTQLTVTSYYAASSASHYGISLLTRRIEEANTSHSQPKRNR